MLSDMARTNITTLVPMMAPACHTGLACGRIGCDGMIWSQKRIPVTKKLPCISQTWTSWFRSDRSNRAGTCQSTMTALNDTRANHGFRTSRPTGRRTAAHVPEQEEPPHPAPGGDRQGEQEGDPGGADHDEDRGVEGDEQVLEHVDEEVVARPVVDR